MLTYINADADSVSEGAFDSPKPLREVLAKRIIKIAKRGERNQQLLCSDALVTAYLLKSARPPESDGEPEGSRP
jgi:hypothetical protein